MRRTHVQIHQTHAKIARRLRRAEGHLRRVIAMVEEKRPCLDLAQQLHAVEKAIGGAKKRSFTTMSIIASTPPPTGEAGPRGMWWASSRRSRNTFERGLEAGIFPVARSAK